MKKKTKIESASIRHVDDPRLRPFMEKILDALGHKEAFVTDESKVWDFTFSYTGKSKTSKLGRISKKLGFKVKENDFLVDLAEKLRGDF